MECATGGQKIVLQRPLPKPQEPKEPAAREISLGTCRARRPQERLTGNQPQDLCNQPQDLCNQPQDLCNQPQDLCNQPQDLSNQPRGQAHFDKAKVSQSP
jgi:hypothetical protein